MFCNITFFPLFFSTKKQNTVYIQAKFVSSVILDKEKEVVVFAQTMNKKGGWGGLLSFNDKTHFSSIILNAFFFQLTPLGRGGESKPGTINTGYRVHRGNMIISMTI